jgi:hypothetical protein
MRGTSFGLYDIPFRGSIESDRINDALNDVVEDIGEAFLRGGRIDSRIDEVKSDMSYQVQQLLVNQAAANAALTAAHAHYDTKTGGLLYWSAYEEAAVTRESSRYDPTVGEVTLPWTTSWTKLPLYKNEYGEYEVGSDVSIQIKEDSGALTTITKPNDAFDMLDNNPETAWVATYPVATAPSTVTVVVMVPPLFSTYINSIMISPFPIGGCNVNTLEYFDTVSWKSVPGFVTSPYSRRYHFSKVSVPGNVGARAVLHLLIVAGRWLRYSVSAI